MLIGCRFFTVGHRKDSIVYLRRIGLLIFYVPWELRCEGFKPDWGGWNDEKTEIVDHQEFFLGNDRSKAYSYNGRLIGRVIWAFDWYQFRRPWITINDRNAPYAERDTQGEAKENIGTRKLLYLRNAWMFLHQILLICLAQYSALMYCFVLYLLDIMSNWRKRKLQERLSHLL